jgi:hypothetical protein
MVNRPFRIHQQIHIAPPCCIIQPRTEEPYPSIGTGQFMRNQANGVELLGKKSHDDTGKASDDRSLGNSRQARISASLTPAHSHIRSDRTVVC